MTLQATNITVKKDGVTLVKGVSLILKRKALSVVIGPNGAGKSMVIKSLSGVLKPTSGEVYFMGKDIASFRAAKRAKEIAYLPQSRTLAWPNRVIDLIALGRFAYGINIASLKGRDKQAVEKAIDACGLAGLEGRLADTLSGGELARVHLARAFATEAPILIADEPVTSLDPYHQLEILKAMKAYTAEGGTALIVLHDLALAAQMADHVIALKAGSILTEGSPGDVLTPDTLKTLFGVSARIEKGIPLITADGL